MSESERMKRLAGLDEAKKSTLSPEQEEAARKYKFVYNGDMVKIEFAYDDRGVEFKDAKKELIKQIEIDLKGAEWKLGRMKQRLKKAKSIKVEETKPR